MATEVVGRDVAENEFQRWADALDLDTNEEAMEGVDKASYLATKKTIIDAMVRGKLTVSADGEVVTYRARGGREVKIPQPTGRDFINGDGARDGTTRLARILAAMNGVDASVFTALPMIDLRIIEGVIGFLSVP